MPNKIQDGGTLAGVPHGSQLTQGFVFFSSLCQGLEVIESTNLKYFTKEMTAEFFALKGMFLAHIGRYSPTHTSQTKEQSNIKQVFDQIYIYIPCDKNVITASLRHQKTSQEVNMKLLPAEFM